MKFAKALEDLMVPEWRSKYVEYKVGKKKIKVTAHKLRTATPSPAIHALHRSTERRQAWRTREGYSAGNGSQRVSLALRRTQSPREQHSPGEEASAKNWNSETANGTILETGQVRKETMPLQHTDQPISRRHGSPNYGSMAHSPVSGNASQRRDSDTRSTREGPPSLMLPDPMRPVNEANAIDRDQRAVLYQPATLSKKPRAAMPSIGSNKPGQRPAYIPGQPLSIKSTPTVRPNTGHTADTTGSRPLFTRVLTTLGRTETTPVNGETHQNMKVRAEAEKEFLEWLLGELYKCEEFYALREQDLVQRFDEMREQLDVMRDLWYQEKLGITFEDDDVEDVDGNAQPEPLENEQRGNNIGHIKRRAKWKTITDAMNDLTRPQPTVSQTPRLGNPAQDYERSRPHRKPANNPPHRVAKRKLKKAYIEYYHGLEMLKSYTTLNRECFRKITKKFDKTSGLRTSSRFMNEYVDKSYFGGAENRLDHLINDTEELFARFFEKGNRKEASTRLRSKENNRTYYASVWRSGLYLGSGLIIGAYALYTGINRINDSNNPELATRTNYLFQFWGGVALILAQALLYAINFRVWSKNKINYSFIFEFDARHTLNYREFLELPALFSLIFIICFWLSVYDFWPHKLDMIHYPIIYVVIVLVLLLNPFRFWYYHARRWFLIVMWRLIFSGFYRVEFKDFWMGDLLCSQTYALSNISLFFCLYARDWQQPAMCNSSHSRLMGFFATAPGILRLLQCFRRYHSSKMWFPHLINGGKYTFTILYYMTLSIWRIDKSNIPAKAAFIAFAAGNAVYTTIWDLAMDWSLLNPYAPYPFLREQLGFKQAWVYYLAMFIDPVIRFQWIFYIIYQSDLQHSALLSFLLSLAEVGRRFMWCFFRMENEHIGNVGANRAYRDFPLPFQFASQSHMPLVAYQPAVPSTISETGDNLFHAPIPVAVTADLERIESRRRRMSEAQPSPVVRTMTRVGRSMHHAHLNDYERKRPNLNEDGDVDDDSSSDEECEDLYRFTHSTEEGP